MSKREAFKTAFILFATYSCTYVMRKAWTGMVDVFDAPVKLSLASAQTLWYGVFKVLGVCVIPAASDAARAQLLRIIPGIQALGWAVFSIAPASRVAHHASAIGIAPLAWIWTLIWLRVSHLPHVSIIASVLGVSLSLASPVARAIGLLLGQWTSGCVYSVLLASLGGWLAFSVLLTSVDSAVSRVHPAQASAPTGSLQAAAAPAKLRGAAVLFLLCGGLQGSVSAALRDWRDTFQIDLWLGCGWPCPVCFLTAGEVVVTVIVATAVWRLTGWGVYTVAGSALLGALTLAIGTASPASFVLLGVVAQYQYIVHSSLFPAQVAAHLNVAQSKARDALYIQVCEAVGYIASAALPLLQSYVVSSKSQTCVFFSQLSRCFVGAQLALGAAMLLMACRLRPTTLLLAGGAMVALGTVWVSSALERTAGGAAVLDRQLVQAAGNATRGVILPIEGGLLEARGRFLKSAGLIFGSATPTVQPRAFALRSLLDDEITPGAERLMSVPWTWRAFTSVSSDWPESWGSHLQFLLRSGLPNCDLRVYEVSSDKRAFLSSRASRGAAVADTFFESPLEFLQAAPRIDVTTLCHVERAGTVGWLRPGFSVNAFAAATLAPGTCAPRCVECSHELRDLVALPWGADALGAACVLEVGGAQASATNNCERSLSVQLERSSCNSSLECHIGPFLVSTTSSQRLRDEHGGAWHCFASLGQSPTCEDASHQKHQQLRIVAMLHDLACPRHTPKSLPAHCVRVDGRAEPGTDQFVAERLDVVDIVDAAKRSGLPVTIRDTSLE